MQPKNTPLPITQTSQAAQQSVPAHHTRQEDAEYIGIEILKDTVAVANQDQMPAAAKAPAMPAKAGRRSVVDIIRHALHL